MKGRRFLGGGRREEAVARSNFPFSVLRASSGRDLPKPLRSTEHVLSAGDLGMDGRTDLRWSSKMRTPHRE